MLTAKKNDPFASAHIQGNEQVKPFGSVNINQGLSTSRHKVNLDISLRPVLSYSVTNCLLRLAKLLSLKSYLNAHPFSIPFT